MPAQVRGLAAVVVILILVAPAIALPVPDVAPVRFIVGFHDPPPLAAGDAFAGGRVLRVDEALRFAVVFADAAFPLRAASDPRVRYVETDAYEHLLLVAPDDPRWGDQYGPQQIAAPVAWDTSLGATSVVVCLVDTGVRYTHEDLAGARWGGGRDYANSDLDPWDDHGHGTHVTGTVAASTNNALGVAGMAQVTFKHVKALDASGNAFVSDVASGFRWCADHGADVLSLSIGSKNHYTSWEDGIGYAWSAGALPMAAAGNDGCSPCVRYPAKFENAVAVGCVTSTDAVCSFSSRGPEVELAGPGFDVISTYHTFDTAYARMSGTSMSTPHVAGVAALAKSVEPGLTNLDLRQRLQETADDLGSAGRDGTYGFGLVRADLAIGNVAPTMTSVGCSASNTPAGKSVTCAFAASDTAGSEVHYEVDWGDGSPPERVPAVGTVAAGTSASASHRWSAPGSYVVEATATDAHANAMTSAPLGTSLTVVANAAPSAPTAQCARSPSSQGSPVTCSFAAADDSDGVAFLVDWGDGSAVERVPASGFVAPGDVATASYAWDAAGEFSMFVAAVDDGEPAATSPATSRVQRVLACNLDRTETLLVPAAGVTVDGFSSRLFALPPDCGDLLFALTAADAVDDFDACWYAGAVRLACHATRGGESAIVPDGADHVRILLVAGNGGPFRLRIPAAPGPDLPGATVILRDDDGEEDALFAMDGREDEAEKRLVVPHNLRFQVESATLLVYGRATACATGGASWLLVVDDVPLQAFAPCSVFPTEAFGYGSFALPPDLLVPGTHRFRLVDTGSAVSDNVALGLDTDTSVGRSIAREDGIARTGELMWHLAIVRP